MKNAVAGPKAGLASPPEPPAAALPTPDPEERARLLALLRRQGILHASPTQPVLSRDGTSARWMLDSLCVSLSAEGIELAARCLLPLLERFEGRQIATLGTTAIPLVAACVMASGGRYRGLLVRKEVKAHGSRKRIEGRIDPHEPVIILDDSVSSGTTMTECAALLEEAGLWVEGGVCLVRFGWYGGFALMQERGYRMEAVFDIWDDFIYHMEGEADPVPNPTKVFPEEKWAREAAPEGLHPAALARLVIESWLEKGELLRPPECLDAEYDAAGGTWISVRSRENIYLRHARDGFWHFPEEGEGGPLGRDLTLAAFKTAAAMPPGEEGLRALEDSAVAVTFFSRLEPCRVGELDNDRYGIVVRSRERLGRMGGALPRMPGIATAWQQFQHARTKNAGLVSFEPYELLRHEVTKVIEPDVRWQPTGVPREAELSWLEDPERAGRIALRARELVLEELGRAAEGGEPPPEDPIPEDLHSLYLTVYLGGELRGCMGSGVEDLEVDLRRLARLALGDRRFAARAESGEEDEIAEAEGSVAVTVSFLHHLLDLGDFSAAEVVQRVRHGEQALLVHQGERSGMLLPFVGARGAFSPEAYALEVIDKAGITRAPYHWRRFECATWLADGGEAPRPLEGALPLAPPPAEPAEQITKLGRLTAGYLLRHQREDGSLFFRYRPHQDVLYEGGDLPRAAHGAWVLARAGRRLGDPALAAAARKAVARLFGFLEEADDGPWLVDGKGEPSVAELSFLLLALAEAAEGEEERGLADRLADHLWARIDPHGRVDTHREEPANADLFQDYFPGQLLLALAAAARAGVREPRPEALGRAFRHYRHRFQNRRRFGQASWQMQAASAWCHVLSAAPPAPGPAPSGLAAYAFEIAEWLLEHQEAGGGFLNDHQSDSPGYTTALYLEGLGAATRLAEARGEAARAGRYREAAARGFAFVDRLTIQEHQAALLPNPAWAVGGVRSSLRRDEVRIDFVQHALSAALELHPVAEEA